LIGEIQTILMILDFFIQILSTIAHIKAWLTARLNLIVMGVHPVHSGAIDGADD
jgi:hypothetical protein